MAADWIKMASDIHEKPEVVKLATALEMDSFAVVGRLHRIWTWFDLHTLDGIAKGIDATFLDRLVTHEGFAAGMSAVGWLEARNGSLTVPNFDRHNGKSAKDRALHSLYVRRKRDDSIVTKPSPDETRRDETSKKNPPFFPPTISEVKAYCEERANSIDPQRFLDYYESQGWKIGKHPMKDWKAAIRTWEQNQQKGLFSNGRTTSNRVGPGQRFQD